MIKASARIAILYTLFAVLSIFINIGSQMLSISVYKGPFSVEISILVGTILGLPLRYFLEKRYIFAFTSKNLVHDGKLFVFYSAMGAGKGIFRGMPRSAICIECWRDDYYRYNHEVSTGP